MPGADWPACGRLVALLATCLIAVTAYLYGLDSSGIASNGDESVYIRMARLTAESGHLLPLRIDFPKFQNTKPPLLFWQAIAATDGGRAWTLWRLRLPSVVYTLLTASLIAALARHWQQRWETALLGALSYLAFYNTFRYGRPLLTDPPEVFWLTLFAFGTLRLRPWSLLSRFGAPLLTGIVVGIACLYKSFALVLPALLVLAGWHFDLKADRIAAMKTALPRLAVTALTALGVFSLWFAFDPDPGAIWRDFVLGQNVGKLGQSGSYMRNVFAGGDSVPQFLISSLANAGVLAPVLVALLIDAWRHRRSLTAQERWLWIWVIGYFVAFSLPSHRSGRYLLPAMPALALLAALAWTRLPRAGFVLAAMIETLLAAVLMMVSREFIALQGGVALPGVYWALLTVAVLWGLAATFRPRYAADAVVPISLGLLLASGIFVRAYDEPPGPFSAATRAAVRGEIVWVPCEFAAAAEAHRFLLPQARLREYREGPSAAVLAARYQHFAVYAPLDTPVDCEGCTLIGSRILLRGRRAASQWSDLLQGHVSEDLFAKELVFDSSLAGDIAPVTTDCSG
jgi:Dolichyl-phosphate-mannose-protein mannosyltransferase